MSLRLGFLAAAFSSTTGIGCRASGPEATAWKPGAAPIPAADWVIASPPGTKRPPFTFKEDDDRLLDEIQRGAFWFLWRAGEGTKTGMAPDRTSVKFASAAGVGFQLAAMPIGVERGWVTREEAKERALRIVRALEANPDNRKAGLFFHYLDADTAGPVDNDVVSTIDSALLFAGIMVAGSYFGGEVATVSDRLVNAADWKFFVLEKPKPDEPYLKGFVSLGWKPTDFKKPTGEGKLLPYVWGDAGDEQRLVMFLAAGAKPEQRVDPKLYYRMRRAIGEFGSSGPVCFFPWSGALFTNFFAHCFIDYAGMGPDNPRGAGVERRASIDWWENSRRAVTVQRDKAIANPKHVPTLGENAWGLTACDGAKGYMVPGVFPNLIAFSGSVPQVDVSTFTPKDDFGDGTVAPYGAGCSIMFQPDAALAALRHYRNLKGSNGEPLVWREPGKDGRSGEYGFRDSFNLGTNWVAPDYVAIDQGPLCLAIENARSGLVWKEFHKHPLAKSAAENLGWTVPRRGGN